MALPNAPSTPSADNTAAMSDEQLRDQQFTEEIRAAVESCPGQTIISGATGFAAGGIVGLVSSSMRIDDPILTGIPATMGGKPGGNMRSLAGLPVLEQFKHGFKDMTTGTWKSARNFAYINALFVGSKCTIGGLRSKDDVYNSGIAGCATGSWVTRATGPKGCVVGCAGFAMFSTAMDFYLNREETVRSADD